MFYITWFFGVLLAILFSAVMTIRVERKGHLDE